MATFTKEMLKNLINCQSKQAFQGAMNATRVIANEEHLATIAATDGHVLLVYDQIYLHDIDAVLKKELGVTLPAMEPGEEISLYLEPRTRKKLDKAIIETGEHFPNFLALAPPEYPKSYDMDITLWPPVTVELQQKWSKITGKEVFLPDFWSPGRPTYTILDNGYLAIMSMDIRDADWRHAEVYEASRKELLDEIQRIKRTEAAKEAAGAA